jgi:DNA polymerase-3 subunit beta
VLEAVALTIGRGSIELAATDGHRLSIRSFKVKGLKAREDRALIPEKTARIMAKACAAEGEVEVVIADSGNAVYFGLGDLRVASRLVEGHYPDYGKVVPAISGPCIEVERAQLRARVNGLGALAGANSAMVRLRGDQAGLVVEALQGEAEGSAGLACRADGSVSVALNADYLSDALAATCGEYVLVICEGPLSTVMLRPAGPEELVHLLMPIRVAA